jgi:hypothetical protein
MSTSSLEIKRGRDADSLGSHLSGFADQFWSCNSQSVQQTVQRSRGSVRAWNYAVIHSKRIIVAILCLTFAPASLSASLCVIPVRGPAASLQSSIPTSNAPPEESTDSSSGPSVKRLLTTFEFWLSLEVLLFGVIIGLLEYIILRNKDVSAEDTLRVFAITLILVGTLFAITAGFDSNQIAPAMGLFGTIAGYILGKRTTPQTEKEDKK